MGIYIVLKNYKYTKYLFLNILRCNHLPTKTKTKNVFFFNIRLARIFFFFVEVRAFTVVMLKILVFLYLKKLLYLFYHLILQYTHIKCSIFFTNSF